MRLLILGGSSEARTLAEALVAAGHHVTTSLAGRTRQPASPPGRLRIGGFGGVPGLCAYLGIEPFDWLIDATHPYAVQMSGHAVAASRATGVPLLRLNRPGWSEPAGAGWLHVEGFAAAATALPAGACVMLTTGHAGLATFLARGDCRFVVRLIEAPDLPLPAHAELLLDRPPYGFEEERAVMRAHAATHLVSKNSGAAATAAKLEAARSLGVVVVMVQRPTLPPAFEVSSVAEALAALHSPSRR